MADTATKSGAKFAPGTEPKGDPLPPEEDTTNPISGVEQLDEHAQFDAVKTAVYALVSGDLGAARRALFGDADHGIHGRLPDEVANPVPDVAKLDALSDRLYALEAAVKAQRLAEGAEAGSTAIKEDTGPLAAKRAEAQEKADKATVEAAQAAADAAKDVGKGSKK